MFNKLRLMKRKSVNYPTISHHKDEDGKSTWIISIRGIIGGQELYTDVCNILLTASEDDTVIITLNTPGGVVFTGLAIIHAMQKSRATVVTRVIGMAASCGALIWSYGQKLEMCPFSRLMFHASSGGFMGKTRDQRDYAEVTETLMKSINQRALTKNIITAKQFEDMFEARQDVYLNSKDLENNNVEFNYAS
jgi:ATP-dependent Clp endopeptidase proteolytic subunit ClpP